jgi:hypothetical protein
MQRLKFVQIFILIFLLVVPVLAQTQTDQASQQANSNSTSTNSGNAITIPSGTLAKVRLENSLSSKINEVGDEVVGTLEENILLDTVVALRRGTEIRGRITQVAAAKRPQHQASMTIIFDKLVTSSGVRKIDTSLKAIDDYANEQKKKADSEGKVQGGHSTGRTIDNTIKGGTLGTIVGLPIVLLGGRTAGATVPLGGATAGVLLSKGNDIKLSPGTVFRIEFTKQVILSE